MRILFFGILFLHIQLLLAGGFQIFQLGGLYGIKDEEGDVLVPAVYEELGWSNNTGDVFNEVIGFKKGGKWGIVSIKNKILAEGTYHSLEPFGAEHLKASVKGKQTNQRFYGLLEPDGDIEVSFNYSRLDLVQGQIRASIYEETKTKVGVLNFDNEVLIPFKYAVIKELRQWLIAEDFDQKKEIYDSKGRELVSAIDSVDQLSKGLVCYRSGLAGFLSDKGKLVYNFDYKDFDEIKTNVRPVPFQTWEVFSDATKIGQWGCDSLTQHGGFWVIYLNGAHHIVLSGENKLMDHDLMGISDDQMIVRHSITKSWAVLEKSGNVVFDGYDEIMASGKFYFAQKDGKWDLYNRFGSKINKFPFDHIKEGVEDYFISKRDDYWGVIDFKGEIFLEFKYDSINLESQDLYSVQFFNKWGIMNKYGNWTINPNFQELHVYDRLSIGYRGALRSFFFDGSLFANLTYPIATVVEGVPILEEEGRYGLINPTNSMLYRPEFDTVIVRGELLHLHKDSAIMLLHRDGVMKVDFEEGYEHFGRYSYGHVPVMKNGKWGFVDRQSRLRIANRYDEVRPFSEGFAPIKLKGRWGFIDTKENLVVQPFYSEVSPFQDGLSIFQTDEGYGLVNAHGTELLSGYYLIERLPSGNYLVESKDRKLGLADKGGTFILRPDFTKLSDIDGKVIVEKNGKMGVLDYSGNQLLNIGYTIVENTDNYLVAKK